MSEYCVFQKFFDPFLYLQKPLDLNKDFESNKHKIIEHGCQIPSKFIDNYSQEENLDLCSLNKIKKNELKIKYILKNDYLELFIFFKLHDKIYLILDNEIVGKKIINYLCDNYPNELYKYRYDFAKIMIKKPGFFTSDDFIYFNNKSNFDMVKLLINNGVDTSNQDLIRKYCGNYQNLKFLIDKGFKNHNYIPFYKCCEHGMYKNFKLLLKNGNTEFSVSESNIIFETAIESQNFHLVRLLIYYGFHEDFKKNITLNSPCNNVIRLLIKHGFNVTNNLEPESHPLCDWNKSQKEIDEIVNSSSEDIINGYFYHSYKIAKSIIKKYKNLNFEEFAPFTCELKNYKTLKLLIKNGIDINMEDGELLIISCKTGNLKIVNLLINNGADVAVRDNEPLIISIKNEDLKLLNLLINNGADLKCRNNMPYKLAIDSGNPDLEKLFFI